MLSIQTHTHVHTHGHTPPPCPPLFFLALSVVCWASLRLFRLLLRFVSLPQSRAKYSFSFSFFYTYLSFFFFLHLPFSLALLALLFRCFFLLFLRLFRYLCRLSTRAPPSGAVCVCVNPCAKGFNTTVSTTTTQQGRGVRLDTST